MDSSDRREALAFLEDSSESTGASDQIVGNLIRTFGDSGWEEEIPR